MSGGRKREWPLTCQRCGVEFLGWRESQKFCSKACNARRGNRPQSPTRTRRAARDRVAAGLTAHARGRLLARWRRQGRPCAYCGGAADTVDHVIPLIRGGDNYEGNLVPACRACNASKCDFLIVEWRRRQAPGATVQPLWRGKRPRPRRKPRGPEVQQALSVCPICGCMYQGNGKTCGDQHCWRERNRRQIRDRYRREHGIPVDESEPTLYWIKLHGLPDTRRHASRRSA